MEDYGDDEYFDGSEDADLGDMLKLHGQREEHDIDDVSTTSDDVTSDDVTALNDDETSYDRKSSVVDQLKEDFEKFLKMRREKEKFKVDCLR